MSLEKIQIRTAGIGDSQLLRDLSVTTFVDAFGPFNRKEDMDKYIATDLSPERLTEELADAQNIFYLISYVGQEVGFAKIRDTHTPPELEARKALEVERIYVLREFHGQKIGSALFGCCMDYAINNHYEVIWLGVWEQNHRAVNFYQRWGFEFFGSHPFLLGDDLQTDLMMKKEINF